MGGMGAFCGFAVCVEGGIALAFSRPFSGLGCGLGDKAGVGLQGRTTSGGCPTCPRWDSLSLVPSAVWSRLGGQGCGWVTGRTASEGLPATARVRVGARRTGARGAFTGGWRGCVGRSVGSTIVPPEWWMYGRNVHRLWRFTTRARSPRMESGSRRCFAPSGVAIVQQSSGSQSVRAFSGRPNKVNGLADRGGRRVLASFVLRSTPTC